MRTTTTTLDTMKTAVHTVGTLVLGSGAAGLNCCERLLALGCEDVVLATGHLGGGTSNLSGSDKQTYYKLGISGDDADSPLEFARTLVAGGMMHGDLAYIEGVLSPAAFFHLVENGVPFPHDRLGTYVGYKTDHDPRQRATSAGPKTSHFMVQRSLDRLREKDLTILDKHTLVALLTDRTGACVGALCIDRTRVTDDDPGLVLFNCVNTVLATGGPGELYGVSVYPKEQTGAHGAALLVGAEANNLSESQFGLASTKFRWNLSGTYQQVVPHYFSVDADGGDERPFLCDYFENMPDLATAVFLKGYQWPFHAAYTQDYGSSVVDIAVENEIRAGRRVFLDFTRNPQAADGLEPFDLDALHPEALDYLRRSGATQATPYERLAHMNPDAIALYAEQGIDLRDPLEAAVCFQHNNGGLCGTIWWESASVPHLFVVGETCGSHGVRPGGSALNSGQVGGIRAARRIARKYADAPPTPTAFLKTVRKRAEQAAKETRACLDAPDDAPEARAVRADIQERMSRAAAFLRDPETVRIALDEARTQWKHLEKHPQRLRRRQDLHLAVENRQLCLTQLAFLENIHALIERGGGSRGAYMILDDAGEKAVVTKRGSELRHRAENTDMRGEILVTRYDRKRKSFDVRAEAVRPLPECDSWYETTWAAFREGRVYDDPER